MKDLIKMFFVTLLSLVSVHVLAVFIGILISPKLSYVIYFLLFSMVIYLIVRNYLRNKLNYSELVDGSVLFILIIFPLCLYELMVSLKTITFEQIPFVVWAIYFLLSCSAIINLKFHFISKLIKKN